MAVQRRIWIPRSESMPRSESLYGGRFILESIHSKQINQDEECPFYHNKTSRKFDGGVNKLK